MLASHDSAPPGPAPEGRPKHASIRQSGRIHMRLPLLHIHRIYGPPVATSDSPQGVNRHSGSIQPFTPPSSNFLSHLTALSLASDAPSVNLPLIETGYTEHPPHSTASGTLHETGTAARYLPQSRLPSAVITLQPHPWAQS